MKACRFHRLAAALAVAVPFVSSFAAAPEPHAAAQALVQRYADAVIGVELVVTLKVKMGDREAPPREQRVEVNGTVISETGLTVASLAEVDPQVAFEAMRAMPGPNSRVELLGADFKEVKLRLADGTELAARFVLKDVDLDLAFMAPVDNAAAEPRRFAHVNLENAAEGATLGRFYTVGRAPKVLQRVPLIRATDVMGIVEKPRRFYLMTDLMLGAPAFDLEGRVLGIALQNFANNRRTGLVILPASDVAEIARQAATAQAANPE
ncbi:MAG TPA: trypsin-like peptidase domain-containing protein [Opitutus sp.]|nr:trypsin-like peptidase domain-containing protein [Opitutus sp.]